ncbi:MAG: PilZ domain-containing protein [Gammaproteobacteria bacterium]|nr:PilZ domain-containing protein [Gammaproteobacteria bacterium]
MSNLQQESINRRIYDRISLGAEGTLNCDGLYYFVKTCDLSAGGTQLVIETDTLPSKDKLSVVRFDGPGFGALARILWHRSIGEGTFTLGMEFIKAFPLSMEEARLN